MSVPKGRGEERRQREGGEATRLLTYCDFIPTQNILNEHGLWEGHFALCLMQADTSFWLALSCSQVWEHSWFCFWFWTIWYLRESIGINGKGCKCQIVRFILLYLPVIVFVGQIISGRFSSVKTAAAHHDAQQKIKYSCTLTCVPPTSPTYSNRLWAHPALNFEQGGNSELSSGLCWYIRRGHCRNGATPRG